MQKFATLTAVACPLPMANVDTDQLIPARFMKRSRADGYGGVLLHDLRFDAEGVPRGDIALDAPAYAGAAIIVARRNFGCGSSREAAVYALADYGISCVLAPSFGDIFAANAVNNGLLPARVAEADVEALLAALASGRRTVTVDLEQCSFSCGDLRGPIAVDPVWRTKLLNGWEDVDLTLAQLPAIRAFVARDGERRPWAQPSLV